MQTSGAGQGAGSQNQQLKSLNRQVLTHGGVVKAEKAKAHAHTEYQRFDERRILARHAEADAAVAELKATEKRLPKTKRGKREAPKGLLPRIAVIGSKGRVAEWRPAPARKL